MPSGRLRALAVVLGLIVFGAVVAWFGVVKSHRPGEATSSAAALRPGDQAPTQAGAEQTANPSAQGTATASRESDEAGSRESDDANRDQGKSVASAAPAQAKPADAEPAKPGGPSFDVVRIEPNGESVIAGRGAPGATIEMLRNGRSHARVIADTSGLFAVVAPPLRPGSHEISLSSIAPDGARAQSRESVTVVINADRTTKPLVTLTSPDRPTVVLSAPEPSPKPAAGESAEARAPATASAPPAQPAPPAPQTSPQASPPPPAPQIPQQAGPPPPAPRAGVKIASVEAEEGGRLFVSGEGAPGATVRLYLNESFIAPGGTGSDGKVSFAIGRGMQPGDYRVRLDDVDPISGHVKSRAEVAFKFPAPLTVPLPPQAQPHLPAADLAGTAVASSSPGAGRFPPATPQAGRDAAATPDGAAAGRAGGPSVSAALASRSMDPGTIVVPEINTAIVARGDSLWEISRRIYGQGTRYTVIYDANQKQIRNPDRIYPGQVFVLPERAATR